MAPSVSVMQVVPWSMAPMQLTCSYRPSLTYPESRHLHIMCLVYLAHPGHTPWHVAEEVTCAWLGV